MKRSNFTHKNGSKNMLDCATEKVTLLSDKSIKMLQKGATAQTQLYVSALTKINLKPLNPELLLMCSLWMHTWMSVGFHVKLLKVRSIRLEKCWKTPIPAHCALICICRETQASIWLLSICDHHTPRGLERESKREGEGIVLVTARQFALTTMWRWGLLRFDRLPYSRTLAHTSI